MVTAPVALLKARLSSYLRRLKAGEEIVITERGIPIGRILPLQHTEGASARRQRLIKAGILQPGSGKLKLLLRPPRGDKKIGRAALQALLDERDEGR